MLISPSGFDGLSLPIPASGNKSVVHGSLTTYAYRRGVQSTNVARPATMLTCRSCTRFFVQGDFNSARSRAALRLFGLLLKLSQAESTLTQPTLIDSRT